MFTKLLSPKTLAMSVALMAGIHADAQQNQTYMTYDGAGNALETEALHIVEATNNTSTCVLFQGIPPAFSGLYNLQMGIRKIDFTGGTPLFETMLEDISGSLALYPTKVFHTLNDEYMVVGYSYTSNYMPFVAKFDNTGALLWMNRYSTNVGARIPNPMSAGDVEIEYVADDPGNESYIVTYPATQTFYAVPAGYTDVCIGAMRIQSSTGNVMWSKKYYLPAGVKSSLLLGERQDYPGALVFGNGRYFIGGAKYEVGGMAGDGSFRMSINNLGNIVDNYQDFTVSALNAYHDAIYDANTSRFIMSYTVSLSNMSACGPTQVDIMKFNSTLGYVQNSFYYDANTSENYARSIIETPNADGYVVATMNGNECYRSSGGGLPGLLEVNKIGNPRYYNGYNIMTTGYPIGGAVGYINPNTGLENYALANTAWSAQRDQRQITTDDVGEVCGWFSRPATWDNLTPGFSAPITYITANVPAPKTVMAMRDMGITSSFTDCIDAADPDYYRLTNTLAKPTLKVYPTLIGANNNTINLKVTASQQSKLTATITSVDGKVTGTFSFDVVAGSNDLSLQFPEVAPGTYLLNVRSADNTISKTERIVKQ